MGRTSAARDEHRRRWSTNHNRLSKRKTITRKLMNEKTCDLCGATLQGVSSSDVAGLILCEACRPTDAAADLKGQGWHLTARQWVRQGRTRTAYCIAAKCRAPYALTVDATFSRKGVLKKPNTELLARAGVDSSFARTVHVTSSTLEETARLVRRPGVQKLLQAVVGQGGGIRVRRQGITLFLSASQPEALEVGQLCCRALALWLQEDGSLSASPMPWLIDGTAVSGLSSIKPAS
jgi:hypothetical protein